MMIVARLAAAAHGRDDARRRVRRRLNNGATTAKQRHDARRARRNVDKKPAFLYNGRNGAGYRIRSYGGHHVGKPRRRRKVGSKKRHMRWKRRHKKQ